MLWVCAFGCPLSWSVEFDLRGCGVQEVEGSVKMSSADGAGAMAFKGLGMMLSASKQGMAVLSGGLNKVRKQYATKHEADVLAELKKKGLRPSDILFQGDVFETDSSFLIPFCRLVFF